MAWGLNFKAGQDVYCTPSPLLLVTESPAKAHLISVHHVVIAITMTITERFPKDGYYTVSRCCMYDQWRWGL